jgi:hypothetical protein
VNPYHQIRERRAPKPTGGSIAHKPWTAAELARAIRHRRAGRSAAEIAEKLGRTRNSVIGALHRAGEPGVLNNQFPDPWGLRLVP